MSREITTVVDGLTFAECPRWHEGRIWFVDFYTHRVLSAEEDGSDLRTEAEVPAQPSGLGWLPDGRMLVVSMRDARLLRREPDGTLVTHAELGEHVGGYPNDMVVDAQGRAYVGNFGFDLMGGAPVATAALLRVDPDGGVTAVAQDMWFPNGSVITDDGRADRRRDVRQPGERVRHRGRRVARPTAAPGRSSATLPTASDLHEALGQLVVAPDGCCLDAEGALWIADAVGGAAPARAGRRRDRRRDRCRHRGVRLHARRRRRAHPVRSARRPTSTSRPAPPPARRSLLAVRVDVPHAGRP